MTTITITDREHLRQGDFATFEYVDSEGGVHPLAGPLWAGSGRSLLVGAQPVRNGSGAWDASTRFASATRTVPDLPTEPGAIIHVYEARGVRVEAPVPTMLTRTGTWRSALMFAVHSIHLPEHITDWRPVTIAEVQS